MQSRLIGYFGILYGEQCGTKPALVASAACKIHISIKLPQQGVSVAGVCMIMQVAKTAFIVVN